MDHGIAVLQLLGWRCHQEHAPDGNGGIEVPHQNAPLSANVLAMCRDNIMELAAVSGSLAVAPIASRTPVRASTIWCLVDAAHPHLRSASAGGEAIRKRVNLR